ncbi:MAG: glycosyl hydrolase family 95 catalytic domain-containing protein [Oscillospiraceae bacterium]
MDGYQKCAGHKTIFREHSVTTPANGVPDGPLCGNGDVGVVLGSAPGVLRFWLGKNDMWRAVPHAIGGGMKPLGYLELSSPALWDAPFYAEQRMESAEIVTELSGESCCLLTRTLALRGENVILTTVECSRGETELHISARAVPGDGGECRDSVQGNLLTFTKTYSGDCTEWETAAACAAFIHRKEGAVFSLSEGETVTIVATVATGFDREDPAEWCVQSAQRPPDTWKPALEEHARWWTEFWGASAVSLPGNPLIEEFWYASHYIMACCCGNDDFAPGIFGNWVTTDQSDWGGDYHLNYNYQAPWWGVYSSNHVDLSSPYDTPLLEYMPRARENARKFLNCHGLYAIVGIGPRGLEVGRLFNRDGSENEEAPFWGQKSCAAFAGVNMIMRYYHTLDTDYAQKVYPYLREVAAFWEDYLEFEDGRYVVYNDYVHENPWAFEPARRVAGLDKHHPDNDFNPILTLGLLRQLFKGLLDMAPALQIDRALCDKWEHILTHLSDFPTQTRNGKTVFRYTERGTDWRDDNSLGIQHIYPAGAIGLGAPPELLAIARDIVTEMGRWEDYNAFPTFFTAAARIGYDPDVILSHMTEELGKHGLPNRFIYYGGGGIECCSAVPGCINEMLLQSHEGILRLFPVWNPEQDAAFQNLRTYGAFLVSASIQSGTIGDVEILSEKGGVCRVQSSWQDGLSVVDSEASAEAVAMDRVGASTYEFQTLPGHRYIVKSL